MDSIENNLLLISKLNNEQDCIEFLLNLKRKQGYSCQKCKNTHFWFNVRNVMICSRCRYERPLTAGTIFQNSRKSLHMVFTSLWLTINSDKGISSKELKKVFGIGSYRIAWTLMHKFRVLMMLIDSEKLSGKVYVDETSVGIRIPSKSKPEIRSWPKVLIVADKNNGKIKTALIHSVTKNNIEKILNSTVEKGSTIVTEESKVYMGLLKKGYYHQLTTLQEGEKIIPEVCEVAFYLKQFFLKTYKNYIVEKYLPLYLAEFAFRFNNKDKRQRELLFEKLIEIGMKDTTT